MLNYFNSRRNQIILIVLGLLCSIVYFKNALLNLLKLDFSKDSYYYTRQFDSQERWINTTDKEKLGVEESITLNKVDFRFLKPKDSKVYLRVLVGKPYATITDEYKGLSFIKISSDETERGILERHKHRPGYFLINLSKLLKDKEYFKVSLLREDSSIKESLYIRGIELSVLSKNDFLPNLALMITLMVIPILLYSMIKDIGLSSSRAFISGLLSIFAIYSVFALIPGVFNNYFLYVYLALLIIYMFVFLLKKTAARHLYIFAILFLMITAVQLRWFEIERVMFAAPHPDAGCPIMGYRVLADKMSLFTDKGFYSASPTSHHEPFYPFIVKVFFFIFGSSDFHLRFVSFFFSLVMLCLSYFVAKEMFGEGLVTFLSAGLVAINKNLVIQASYGLRTELEACFMLLLFYFCYLKRERIKPIILWILGVGIIGGGWLLTRAHNILTILFISLRSLLKFGWRLRRKTLFFLLIAAVSVSIFFPYKYSLYKKTRNLSWDIDTYATHLANGEFRDKDGFPKERISAYDYFFRMHTLKELISYNLVGMLGVFYFLTEETFNIIQEQNFIFKELREKGLKTVKEYPYLALLVFGCVMIVIFSLISVLLDPKLRIIIYLIIISTFYNGFVYGAVIMKGVYMLELNRTIVQALPFFIYAISYWIVRNFNRFVIIPIKTRYKL